jgi:hypothetical protein
MRRTALLALGLSVFAPSIPAHAHPRLPFPSPAASVSPENGTGRMSFEHLDRCMAAGESFWRLEPFASHLKVVSKTAEAVAAMRRAVEISKGKAPEGYRKALEETIANRAAEPAK